LVEMAAEVAPDILAVLGQFEAEIKAAEGMTGEAAQGVVQKHRLYNLGLSDRRIVVRAPAITEPTRVAVPVA